MRFALYCIITDIISFFLFSPLVTNFIADFTVKKRFGYLMIQEGIITEETFNTVQKRQVKIGIGFMVVVLIMSITLIIPLKFNAVIRIIGFTGVGIFVHRKSLQYNEQTLRTFDNAYKDLYDIEKFNAFAKKEFNIG